MKQTPFKTEEASNGGYIARLIPEESLPLHGNIVRLLLEVEESLHPNSLQSGINGIQTTLDSFYIVTG